MTSEPNWLSAGQAVFTFAIGIMTAYNAWRGQRADAIAKATAAKVSNTAAKVEAVAGTVAEVHTLVNSAMGVQKKALAEVTSAKAAITHDEADRLAAKEAMDDWLKHVGKQSAVDAAAAAAAAGGVPPGMKT